MEIEDEIQHLVAQQGAILLVIASLMKTHPDPLKLQTDLTARLEKSMGAKGGMRHMNEGQRETVRTLVEALLKLLN